jgi:hypothetical protein
VIEGDLRIDFPNGAVHVRAGEMFVVPKGVEHKPYAENEVKSSRAACSTRGMWVASGQRSRMSGSENLWSTNGAVKPRQTPDTLLRGQPRTTRR